MQKLETILSLVHTNKIITHLNLKVILLVIINLCFYKQEKRSQMAHFFKIRNGFY